MPIPTPNSGESKDDFISRCMSNETMKKEYSADPDNNQRYAICISKWEEKSEAQMYDFRSLIESAKVVLESNDYEVYHKSYTDAIQEIRRYIEKNGYSVDEDDMFRIVGSGPRKPSEGKTNQLSIPLYKNGKPAMRKVEVQVYGMGNRYELNMYFGKANRGMY